MKPFIYRQVPLIRGRMVSSEKMVLQSPLPNDLLSASKLMERKIMFFTNCWKCVGSFEACRHFVGDVGTGKIPKAGRDLTRVRGPPGQVWLTAPLWNCKDAVPPGLVSPVQGGACKIPSCGRIVEFKSQLLPDPRQVTSHL